MPCEPVRSLHPTLQPSPIIYVSQMSHALLALNLSHVVWSAQSTSLTLFKSRLRHQLLPGVLPDYLEPPTPLCASTVPRYAFPSLDWPQLRFDQMLTCLLCLVRTGLVPFVPYPQHLANTPGQSKQTVHICGRGGWRKGGAEKEGRGG